ncbi:MAG: HPP family protein [Geobacteraceae bacterium]|nr:HPP family protein [Geobacteraceae bacterium]
MKKRIARLPGKMKGAGKKTVQPLSLKYALWGSISGSLAILALVLVSRTSGHPLLIGSFGASAVLLFGAAESALAQPRNLVGGHLVSSTIAVAVVHLIGTGPLAISLAVGLSILFMYLTRTIHPPGGSTAFIGVQGHAGPYFIISPVLSGALILLLVALFTNNIVHHRQYPRHWL